MNHSKRAQFCLRPLAVWLVGLSGLMATGTGCQVEMAGQTLPSPYYLTDDVQYYTPGPEFKLANEAAAMQEQAASVAEEIDF